MKVLVVADSEFGNTRTVADAIGDVFGTDARVMKPDKAIPEDFEGLDLLIVGSPTQGGRPLPSITSFLKQMPGRAAKGLRYVAFDTRVDGGAQNFALRLLVNVIGYAAPKIARELSRRGGQQLVPPEGFIVEGKEGPLRDGELDRAKQWARLVQSMLVQA